MRVWPDASGLEASWCAGITWPSFWQEPTGPLPVSHFQTRFRSSTDVPGNIVQNQPGSDLVLADCVRFWPNHSSLEARWCARIIRPTSGQCCQADPDQIRIRSGMFTWKTLTQNHQSKVMDQNSHKNRQPKTINQNSLKTTSQSSIKTTNQKPSIFHSKPPIKIQSKPPTKNHPSLIQNHQHKQLITSK